MNKDINNSVIETLLSSISQEERVQLLTNLLTKTTGGKKGGGEKKIKLEQSEVTMVEGEFADVESAVIACLDQHACIEWSKASKALFGEGPFKSTNCQPIIAAFEAIEKGASALIVSKSGHHAAKVYEQHRAWLLAHDFEKFPASK